MNHVYAFGGGIEMERLKVVLKKLFTPITIMLVPHNSRKTFNLKISFLGLFTMGVFSLIGVAYVLSISVNAFEYKTMRQRLDYYSAAFGEAKTTIQALKKSQEDFQKLFSFKKKEDVLENLPSETDDGGGLDIDLLKKQITESMESVQAIKEYLAKQKDLYEATPRGLPTSGYISSGYGSRIHPITHKQDFHSGYDIVSNRGTDVHATADGVVSIAGPCGGNGNLVVIEHGYGYSTIYAHNQKIFVHKGEIVKRGQVISAVGSTGLSTGPHVHYEVWRNGRAINPQQYVASK